MRTLFQDIRYALRQLRNAPAFTITAVLTLVPSVKVARKKDAPESEARVRAIECFYF